MSETSKNKRQSQIERCRTRRKGPVNYKKLHSGEDCSEEIKNVILESNSMSDVLEETISGMSTLYSYLLGLICHTIIF